MRLSMPATAALALGLGLGAAALAGLWLSGGLAGLGWWVAAQQRALQDLLGGQVAALRAGEAGAVWGLVALCGAYGFLHAMGPGHGKALVAGAAVGTRATARRMALVALAGGLGQAAVAIALVYGAFALVDATARGLTDGAERWIATGGNLVIALVGAWLVLRGLGALRRRKAAAAGGAHGPDCGCGGHGPSAAQVERAIGPAATLGLVAAIAARPCTGAIFLLVIAWRMGLPWIGAAGVAAMGLGTAAFTAAVAWLAVASREAALMSTGGGGAARLLGPGLQIAAGGMILLLGGLAFLGALA